MATELNTETPESGYFVTDSTSSTLTASATAVTTTWIEVDSSTDYVLSGTGTRMRIQFKTSGGTITYYSGSSNDPSYPEEITTASDTAYLRVYYGADTTTLSVKEVEDAPTLSSPTGSATGATTADGGVTTDTANGTLYAVVTTSSTAPSAADIKDGTGSAYDDSVTVSSIGIKSFSATGLTEDTTYYWHFIHVDSSTNDSNIATSSSFTPADEFDGTLVAVTERGNIDLSGGKSSISGNTVTIYPQIYDSYWTNFYFKLTGANGGQPDFKCVWADYLYTDLANAISGGLYPRYSYTPNDVDSWVPCTTVTNGTTTMDWTFDEAFTGDVYISIWPVVTPSMVNTWIAGLTGISEPDSAVAYGGDDYQYNVIAQVTDVNSRVIPAQNQYCFKFGTGSKIAVILGGVHAGEDLGSITMMEAIDYLLGTTPIAVQARSNYTFYVYPMINPQGRYGGHFRFTFESGSTTIDPNRDWVDTTNFDLNCTTNTKNAIATDVTVADIDFFCDFHSRAGTAAVYRINATASTDEQRYEDYLTSYQSIIESSDFTQTSTAGTTKAYYSASDVALTFETGHVDTAGDKAAAAKVLGVAHAVTISRMEWTANTDDKEYGIDFGLGNDERYYKIPSNSALALDASEWTLGFWFYSDDNSGSYWQYLLSMGTYGAANSLMVLVREDSNSTEPGYIQIILRDDNNDTIFPSSWDINAGDGGKKLIVFQKELVSGTTYRLAAYACEEGDDFELLGSTTWNIDTVSNSDLYIGARTGLDDDRWTEEHIGGLFKADFALEPWEIESIAWGLAKPSDSGTLQLDLPMTAADATLTDEANSLVATRYGSSWPTPSVEFVYPPASSTVSIFGPFYYEMLMQGEL